MAFRSFFLCRSLTHGDAEDLQVILGFLSKFIVRILIRDDLEFLAKLNEDHRKKFPQESELSILGEKSKVTTRQFSPMNRVL